MQQANIILGIHGAGMINTCFAKEGSKIIEILDDRFVNVNYWFYANLFNLKYVPLIGQSIKNEDKNRPGFDNINISPKLMEKLIGELNSD